MRLKFLHPEIAARSCVDCKQFMYDDTPQRMGLPVIRGGVHQPRGNTPTPCRWCPKIPASVPANQATADKAVELSERNWLALIHYLKCRAVGRFPADPWVERNAMIIREEMDAAEQDRQDRRVLGMAQHMMAMTISARAT